MNKIWIIILILAGIILLVLFLTKKKSCPGDGTCSGHGTCDTKSGKCNCDPKYTGDYCDTVSCDCSGVGTCDETGKCKCPVNYDGTKCEKCKDGWSGDGCTIKKCIDCSDNGTCGTDGKCACKTDRWHGDNCELCGGVWSGAPTCDKCGCKNDGTCNEDGSCKCIGNYEQEGICENCKDGWGGYKCEGRRLVAVGRSSTELIFYSDDDAITWNKFGDKIDVGGLNGLNGIVWDGTIIVVFGFSDRFDGNTIAYSSDKGLTWTGTGYNLFSMALCISYSGDNFVAGGEGGKDGSNIAYSSDKGVTWTGTGGNVFSNSDVVSGITYGNNTFVAVGNTLIAYSSDKGLTWTGTGYINTSVDYDLISVSYGNNTFVAVGYGIIIYSSDGITWNTSLIEVNFYKIIWCEISKVFVISDLTNTIGYSSDGITWNYVVATGLDYAELLVCNGSRIIISGVTSNAYLSFPGPTLEYEKKTLQNLSMMAIISM